MNSIFVRNKSQGLSINCHALYHKENDIYFFYLTLNFGMWYRQINNKIIKAKFTGIK